MRKHSDSEINSACDKGSNNDIDFEMTLTIPVRQIYVMGVHNLNGKSDSNTDSDGYSDIVGTVKVTLTNTTTCLVTETLGVTRTMTVTMRLTSKEERIVTVMSRLTVKGRETEKETLNLTLR